jgi:hypothetical protein
MCNLYRGPSIDATYQVSVHLAKEFQRRRLKCGVAKMNRNSVGSTYGRFCIKFPQNRMNGERHRLSPLTEPLVLNKTIENIQCSNLADSKHLV